MSEYTIAVVNENLHAAGDTENGKGCTEWAGNPRIGPRYSENTVGRERIRRHRDATGEPQMQHHQRPETRSTKMAAAA